METEKLIIKLLEKCKGLLTAKTFLKKNKVRQLTLSDTRLTIKLQWSRQCSTGITTNKKIDRN